MDFVKVTVEVWRTDEIIIVVDVAIMERNIEIQGNGRIMTKV